MYQGESDIVNTYGRRSVKRGSFIIGAVGAVRAVGCRLSGLLELLELLHQLLPHLGVFRTTIMGQITHKLDIAVFGTPISFDLLTNR